MMNALSLAVHLERTDDVQAGASGLGARGTAADRAHAAHLVFSRTADDMAAGAACRGTRHRRPLEMAGAAAHANGVASADGHVERRDQNGIVIPSIGASQLTRSTRFQAIMIWPSLRTSRCSACAAENTLLLTAIFDHHEFGSHGAGTAISRFLDRHVADHAARPRARLLRIHARAGKPPHPGFEQAAIVVDQRHGLDRVSLVGFARHPVPGVGREQSKPFVEFAVVEQPRFMQQELFAMTDVERLVCRCAGRAGA